MLPDGPKRWGGQLAHDAVEMKSWSEQLTNRYAASNDMIPRDYHAACVYTAEFGGCPFPILHAYVNRKILSANEITEKLLEKKTFYLSNIFCGSSVERFCIDAVRNTGGLFNFWLGEKDLTPREILVEKLHTNESNPEYYTVPSDLFGSDTTLVGCLIRLAVKNGFSWEAGCHPDWELADYVGSDSPRERLFCGQVMKGPVVWFKFGDRLHGNQMSIDFGIKCGLFSRLDGRRACPGLDPEWPRGARSDEGGVGRAARSSLILIRAHRQRLRWS